MNIKIIGEQLLNVANRVEFIFDGAIVGHTIGGGLMLTSMSIDGSNVDWAGPAFGIIFIICTAIGAFIGCAE